jgi:beta-glucosidase
MGFRGWVMSDWGATHSASMNQGLDQEMPGSDFMDGELASLVSSGDVSMEKVDESAVRILWPFFAVGLFDTPNNNTLANNVSTAEHNALARSLAAASTIMLKNDGLLPLSKDLRRIAVIGEQAKNPIVHGGGSGEVEPHYVSTPLDAVRVRVGLPPMPTVTSNCSDGNYEEGIDFANSDDQTARAARSLDECCIFCSLRDGCNAFTYVAGMCWMKGTDNGRTPNVGATSGICRTGPPPPATNCTAGDAVCVNYADGSDPVHAFEVAKDAEVALVFVATTSHEGGDRESLGLDGVQDALIGQVAASGTPTVVVAVSPGALLTPWRSEVSSILFPLTPGQEYGNAITDIIFGDAEPTGRLPISLPLFDNDIGMTPKQYPGENDISIYSEGLEVGYRWYNAHGVQPAFPFGYGLSYTTFAYDAIEVNDADRTVSCVVTNTGERSGTEVAQLYLSYPSSAGEPPKQLKGFQRVTLEAGDSATVKFALDDRSFSIWDADAHAWSLVKGAFDVMVGASVEDIRLNGQLHTDLSVVV